MANHTRPISTQLGHEKRYATCGIFLRMDRDAFPHELSLARRLHKQRTWFQSCGGLVGGCSNIPGATARIPANPHDGAEPYVTQGFVTFFFSFAPFHRLAAAVGGWILWWPAPVKT
jgi:hypothetical protein